MIPITTYTNVTPLVKGNKLYFKVQIIKNYSGLLLIELVPISMFLSVILITLKTFITASKTDTTIFNRIESSLILCIIVSILNFFTFIRTPIMWSFLSFTVFVITLVGIVSEAKKYSDIKEIISEETIARIVGVLLIVFLFYMALYMIS